MDWSAGPTAAVSEADILAQGAKLAADPDSGVKVVDDGNVTTAREIATKTHTATYRTSSVLHFTLEPQNALVEYVDGVFHIHSGNQWQSLILPFLATALGVPETNIVIHQYYLGGGFGRRLFGDQMIPAALAARELGRPVKLIFERADDSRFDCVRSPSVAKFDASFDADGSLTGIEHAAAAGWLRAVGPGWIGWGVESFMDELAAATGEDPVEFRLARLDAAGKNAGTAPNSVGGASRLVAALKDVAQRSGWGKELPEGEGMGVAVSQGQEINRQGGRQSGSKV